MGRGREQQEPRSDGRERGTCVVCIFSPATGYGPVPSVPLSPSWDESNSEQSPLSLSSLGPTSGLDAVSAPSSPAASDDPDSNEGDDALSKGVSLSSDGLVI